MFARGHIPSGTHLIAQHQQSRGGETRIERYKHGASFKNAENARDDLQWIVSEQAYYRAGAHALFEQEVGQPVRLAFQLGVGDTAPGTLKRHVPAKLIGRAAKHVLYALMTHG